MAKDMTSQVKGGRHFNFCTNQITKI
uniref:Uncharacterized protein n=1 Tax=Anguilla anguilla TaxID=7936 RepID=A0A0E9QU63_ANGAN